jgi:transposase
VPIVGGLDIHRKQLTFDYLDTGTGEVKRGQIAPADRAHLRAWLARFTGRDDVAFALEGCTGWRYVAEELTGVGVTAHVAEPADTAFARGRKRHAKTDPRHLRELLAQGRLPECWIPPAHILECRGAARAVSRSAGRAYCLGAVGESFSQRPLRGHRLLACADSKFRALALSASQ